MVSQGTRCSYKNEDGAAFFEFSESLLKDLRGLDHEARTLCLQYLIQLGLTINSEANHLQKLTDEWVSSTFCDRLSKLVDNASSRRQLDIVRRLLVYAGGPTGPPLSQSPSPVLDATPQQTMEALMECLELQNFAVNDFGDLNSIGALLRNSEAFKVGGISQDRVRQRHQDLTCSLGLEKNRLLSYEAASDSNTHIILVLGGGFRGFTEQGTEKDGYRPAKELNKFGFHAHILTRYTCTQDKPKPLFDDPLHDVEGAINNIRNKYPGSHLGLMCWSAGGLLGATLINRVEFIILVYAITSLDVEIAHKESRLNLLGQEPSENQISKFSTTQYVNQSTGPAYIFHSREDQQVVVHHALRLAGAFLKAGRPVKLVLVPDGPHGAHGFGDLVGLCEFLEDIIKQSPLRVIPRTDLSEIECADEEKLMTLQNYEVSQ